MRGQAIRGLTSAQFCRRASLKPGTEYSGGTRPAVCASVVTRGCTALPSGVTSLALPSGPRAYSALSGMTRVTASAEVNMDCLLSQTITIATTTSIYVS